MWEETARVSVSAGHQQNCKHIHCWSWNTTVSPPSKEMTEHVRPSCSTGKLRILIRSSLFSYLILPLVLLQLCSNLASAGSPVKFLPGFEGPLPFELETGWVTQYFCNSKLISGALMWIYTWERLKLFWDCTTRYIGVDESEDVQLFYYFVKSESSPETDPLVLWLTGGNCCTSFSGLAYEIGRFSARR